MTWRHYLGYSNCMVPDRAHKSQTAFYILLFTFASTIAIPLWTLDHPPMQDFPTNFLIAKVIENPGNPVFQGYEWEGIKLRPFSLFYILLFTFTKLMGAKSALLIIISAYILLFPPSVVFAWRMVHRDSQTEPWFIFSTLPFITNPFYFFGLFNFLISLPLFILAFGFAMKVRGEKPNRNHGWLAFLLLLLCLSHPLTYLVSVLMLGVIILGSRDGFSLSKWVMISAAPSILFLVFTLPGLPTTDLADPSGARSSFIDSIRNMELNWWNAGRSLYFFPRCILPVYSSKLLRACGFGPFAIVLFYCLEALKRKRPGIPATSTFPAGGSIRITTLAAALLIFSSFVSPFSVRSFTMINARVFILALLIAILLPGPEFSKGIVKILTGISFGIFFIAAHWTVHVKFNEELKPMSALYNNIPQRQKILPFVINPMSENLRFVEPMEGTPFYYHAEKGGYSPYLLFNPLFPVKWGGEDVPKPPRDDASGFSWDLHGRFYDGFLVVGSEERLAKKLAKGAGLKGVEGRWSYWGKLSGNYRGVIQ